MKDNSPLHLSNSIINLSKNNIDEAIKMVESIKEDDDISQETIYEVAKNVYQVNKYLAIQLNNIISHNLKYSRGFRAYTYCIDQDEEDLDGMINYMKISYRTGVLKNLEAHIEDLNEMVFSIAEYYPSKAQDLLEEIDKVYVAMNEEREDNIEV